VTPINFPQPNPIFEFELREDSMTDKERIALEELQVQTADMYISDNLIGDPFTETTSSLSTELPEKTIPEKEQMTEINETTGTQDSAEEMVVVDKENAFEKADDADKETAQNGGDDGIRVTGSDEGEFVLLNSNDHVDVPGENCLAYLQ
jgi:hypothetical protein